MCVCVCCLCLMHALQLCDLQSFLKASCNCCSCTLALLADSASFVFTMLSQQLWTARRRRRFSGSGLRPDFCRCCSVLYLFMSHFHRGSAGVDVSGSGYVRLPCCYSCVQRFCKLRLPHSKFSRHTAVTTCLVLFVFLTNGCRNLQFF